MIQPKQKPTRELVTYELVLLFIKLFFLRTQTVQIFLNIHVLNTIHILRCTAIDHIFARDLAKSLFGNLVQFFHTQESCLLFYDLVAVFDFINTASVRVFIVKLDSLL